MGDPIGLADSVESLLLFGKNAGKLARRDGKLERFRHLMSEVDSPDTPVLAYVESQLGEARLKTGEVSGAELMRRSLLKVKDKLPENSELYRQLAKRVIRLDAQR